MRSYSSGEVYGKVEVSKPYFEKSKSYVGQAVSSRALSSSRLLKERRAFSPKSLFV